jgi:hypothetical protein
MSKTSKIRGEKLGISFRQVRQVGWVRQVRQVRLGEKN